MAVVHRRLAAMTLLATLLVPGTSRADPTATGNATASEDENANDHEPPKADYNAPDPNRDALSFLRAGANVLVANYVVSTIDWFRGVEWIGVTRDSIAKNASLRFTFDYDPLAEDLLAHPLHGSLYFESARAAGLSFWESSLFPFLGSLQWEVFGERQETYPEGWRSKPSTNDFIATATGGILLGEGLHRLSSELLDESATGTTRALRELGAALVSPMRGFNRLYTGAMWRDGPGPDRPRPVRAALDLGLDRLRTAGLGQRATYDPSALVALQVEYGDLLPTRRDETLEPFEFFEAYVALNLFHRELSGAQVYGQGLLYGWSAYTTDDTGELADNNVIGFVDSFDFQGANLAQFGALSVGPGDYLEWRWGPHRRLRVGTDVGWSYLTAIKSPFAVTDHNYSMGAAVGLTGRLELGRFGEAALRGRQYLTAVVDGRGQEEVIGYGRLSYEVDLLPHVGIGAAPTIIHRRSSAVGLTINATSLETQLYLRVHN